MSIQWTFPRPHTPTPDTLRPDQFSEPGCRKSGESSLESNEFLSANIKDHDGAASQVSTVMICSGRGLYSNTHKRVSCVGESLLPLLLIMQCLGISLKRLIRDKACTYLSLRCLDSNSGNCDPTLCSLITLPQPANSPPSICNCLFYPNSPVKRYKPKITIMINNSVLECSFWHYDPAQGFPKEAQNSKHSWQIGIFM